MCFKSGFIIGTLVRIGIKVMTRFSEDDIEK